MHVVLDSRVVTGSGGGPEKTILNSPRFLSAAGYRMLCAYMHPPGDPGFEQLRQKALAAQAPLYSVSDRGPWDWRVLVQLLRICRRERVEIWHGHDYKSNALGLLLRRFWPMRLVSTVHGWVRQTRRTPLYYKIDELCLPHYEAIICVSKDLQERCIACGVPAQRCQLIENAIDTEEYSRRIGTDEAKKSLGLTPGRFLIGAVGRLSSEKGFEVLIRATDQLLKTDAQVELAIIGVGEQKDQLQALIAQLGRQDRIRLWGYRADVRDLYAAMDIFALSSVREGLPNVLLEAMAMEVPVVATRIAGIPSLIQDGQNGLLVEPSCARSLTEALTRLLEDAALRIRLRQAARATVENQHSFFVRMQKLSALYDQLLRNDEFPMTNDESMSNSQ
jgi:glycosyltransferase involved in cell wall biosynthesis